MKLYSYWRSSSAWRVRIVLAWKGIPYEYVAVNLLPDAAENASAGYAAVNPLEQVPTLEWTEAERVVRLAQSVAIAEYLEERFPQPHLFPKTTLARARMRQAVEIINSGIQPLQNSGTIAALRALSDEDQVRAWVRNAMVRGLAALESLALGQAAEFLVGDEPSLADAYLVPQLYNARRYAVDLTPYPKLTEIEAAAVSLEAFARAHPDEQPDAPSRVRNE
ncbi:MAG TPA: maleylacetoacetate isomerase [Polyangiaceae bacterium]|nr:maleylacetoacetate isomerase [Polyangiaceae bacterium]